MFNLVLSLGEKGLGLHQRLQLPPVEGKEPTDTRMGKAGRADTLQELPGHGDSSRFVQFVGIAIVGIEKEGKEHGGRRRLSPKQLPRARQGCRKEHPRLSQRVGLLCLLPPAQGPPSPAASCLS